jgi:type VI secretion system secreted protein Hcp
MADEKKVPEQVQRYRFKVRAADGRELVSQIANLHRPSVPVDPVMADVPVSYILVGGHGAKQGAFKASAPLADRPGKGPHQFAAIAFDFMVVSPRDAASGLPTGKLQHRPLVLTKELAPSTPQLLQALAQGEALEVLLDCYGQVAAEPFALAHSIKLTNAKVASVDFAMLDNKRPALAQYKEFEQVALTFETLEWTKGPAVVSDSWA